VTERRPRRTTGSLRLVCLALAVVALGGCGLPLFNAFEPSTRLFPPPGDYDEPVHVMPDRGDDARFFWTTDPSVRLEDFEEMHDIHVNRDLSFRYYVISSRGIRSPIVEAVYTISDGAPVIDVKAIGQRNTSFYSYQIQWPMVEPGRAQDFGFDREIPFDESHDWYELEYAVYSSERNDIDSISAAIANGRREMGWFRYHDLGDPANNPGDWPFYSAMRPGERRFFNVFTRDPNGNTAAYGTRVLSSRPALSVYVAITGAPDEMHLHVADTEPIPPFFVDPSTPIDFVQTKAVALGRIDDDILEDLAIVHDDAGNDLYSWYRMRPNGTVDEANPERVFYSEPSSTAPRSAAIADMTGDDRPDVVFNTGTGDILVADAWGSFFGLTPGDATDFAIGDVDNDGINDVVSINTTPGLETIHVWRGNGFAGFQEVTQGWAAPEGINGLALADLDRDGNLDLIVAVPFAVGAPGVELYYGDGTGQFTEAFGEDAFWPDDDTMQVAVADFDRDGWPDLFFSNAASDSVVYRNNQDGTFGLMDSVTPTVGVSGAGARITDIDGDGSPDVVEWYNSGASEIWLNDGAGAFSSGGLIATSSPIDIAVGQVR
jgi:hypothetical protein